MTISCEETDEEAKRWVSEIGLAAGQAAERGGGENFEAVYVTTQAKEKAREREKEGNISSQSVSLSMIFLNDHHPHDCDVPRCAATKAETCG